MKKLIILGAILINVTSCIAQKTECEQTLIDWRNYEDTIKIEFIGIDSSIFKGKNYKLVADSLHRNGRDNYHRYDLQNIQTGYIHRIVFERAILDSNFKLYDKNIYERVR